jgi:hypothetical protein
MDVILDSNRYLSDTKMAGAKFQSLFAYLHKTAGSIVIPRIVRDEVLARHEDKLRLEYKDAVANLKVLRRRVFGLSLPELPTLDLPKELRLLEERLQNPSPGINSSLLPDYSDVNVEEVARRGILRKKPANDKGEELRDVMVWLGVVAYAKKHGKEVGFITDDPAFRRQRIDSELDPDLMEELSREKITVHFAVGIDDFVKAHSPAPRSISAEREAELLSPEQKVIIKRMFRLLTERALEPFLVISATEPTLQFKTGGLYEVSPESAYVELEYEGTSVVDIAEGIFHVAPSAYTSSATVTVGQVSLPYQFENMSDSPSNVRPLSHPARGATALPQPNTFGNALAPPAPLDRRSILISVAFTVSFRLVNGRVSELGVDPGKFREISRQVL